MLIFVRMLTYTIGVVATLLAVARVYGGGLYLLHLPIRLSDKWTYYSAAEVLVAVICLPLMWRALLRDRHRLALALAAAQLVMPVWIELHRSF